MSLNTDTTGALILDRPHLHEVLHRVLVGALALALSAAATDLVLAVLTDTESETESAVMNAIVGAFRAAPHLCDIEAEVADTVTTVTVTAIVVDVGK